MVGAVRFELTTSCTRNKRATRLRYAPTQSDTVTGCRGKNQTRFYLEQVAELKNGSRGRAQLPQANSHHDSELYSATNQANNRLLAQLDLIQSADTFAECDMKLLERLFVMDTSKANLRFRPQRLSAPA